MNNTVKRMTENLMYNGQIDRDDYPDMKDKSFTARSSDAKLCFYFYNRGKIHSKLLQDIVDQLIKEEDTNMIKGFVAGIAVSSILFLIVSTYVLH